MRGIVVDANLLLLLVVGSCSQSLISKHRRLASSYSEADFARLVGFIAEFDKIITVPQALAEVGNLLSDGEDRDARAIKSSFATLVHQVLEVYEPSSDVVEEPEFQWLGLSDAAQLLAAGSQHRLVTADGPLFAAAAKRGVEAYFFQAT